MATCLIDVESTKIKMYLDEKAYVWLGAHLGGKKVLTMLCYHHNSRCLRLLVDD